MDIVAVVVNLAASIAAGIDGPLFRPCALANSATSLVHWRRVQFRNIAFIGLGVLLPVPERNDVHSPELSRLPLKRFEAKVGSGRDDVTISAAKCRRCDE